MKVKAILGALFIAMLMFTSCGSDEGKCEGHGSEKKCCTDSTKCKAGDEHCKKDGKCSADSSKGKKCCKAAQKNKCEKDCQKECCKDKNATTCSHADSLECSAKCHAKVDSLDAHDHDDHNHDGHNHNHGH